MGRKHFVEDIKSTRSNNNNNKQYNKKSK